MAPTFTFESLATDLGTATADGLRNVANTAANFVCNAYQNYSEATSGFSDPTGIGQFNNALYSRLCSPRGQTPASPPSQPFNGGQCPKLYTVTVSYTLGSNPGNVLQRTFFSVLGPIGGLTTKPAGTGNTLWALSCQPNASHPDGLLHIEEGSTTINDPFKIVSIQPVANDGVDNCGNPPPSYPYVTPPVGAVSNTTNVNIGAGAIINAPITIAPVIFDPLTLINPQIQVNVGPFNVTFDAGGVTVSPNFSFGTGGKTSPNPALNPSNPTAPTQQKPGTGNCDCDYIVKTLRYIDDRTKVINDTANIIDNNTSPVPYTFQTQQIASGPGGIVAIPKNCIEIQVEITQQPQNAKIQAGNGNHPDCLFCGYYSFGDGNNLAERVPLNTAQGVFFPPRFATSFGWNLYAGYEANITAVIALPDFADGVFADTRMLLKAS